MLLWQGILSLAGKNYGSISDTPLFLFESPKNQIGFHYEEFWNFYIFLGFLQRVNASLSYKLLFSHEKVYANLVKIALSHPDSQDDESWQYRIVHQNFFTLIVSVFLAYHA